MYSKRIRSDKKLKKFIALLNMILEDAYEIRDSNQLSNIWLKHISTVIEEMEQLLSHALKGEIYFKYGKKQRMLVSSYFMLDSWEPLSDTSLGRKISQLQELYNKV